MRLDGAGFKLNPCHRLVLSVLRNSLDSVSDFSDPDPQNYPFFIFFKSMLFFFSYLFVCMWTICVYVCVHRRPWMPKDSCVCSIGLFHGHMSSGELWSPSLHSFASLASSLTCLYLFNFFVSLIEVKTSCNTKSVLKCPIWCLCTNLVPKHLYCPKKIALPL